MSQWNIYCAAAVACSTASMFGFGTGYIGGVLVLPSFKHHFALDGLSNDALATAQSIVISAWLLGALLGVMLAMPVCSHLGRRMCLTFCATAYVLGALLQIIPNGESLAAFNAGRLLNGIGVGAGTLVGPLYISEISPDSRRGMLLGSWQVSMQISALLGFWGAYISHQIFPDASDLQWGVPVIIQFVPGMFLFFGCFIVPESPKWLAEQNNPDASRQALAWLRSEAISSSDTAAEATNYCQMALKRKEQEAEHPGSTHFSAILRPPIRKRLICGCGLMTLQTLSGTNALNFFAPIIFVSAGFTSTTASLFLTGLFGVVKLGAAIGFMFYFVRVKGHRFWIIIATAVCAASLFVLAFCIKRLSPVDAQQIVMVENGSFSVLGVVACLMVFTFAFFFGIGHGPISWNFCAEWLFQVVNAALTPFLLARLGWLTWIVFGLVNVFTLVWCILYVPETRGVPVGEQMDAVFEGSYYSKALHEENVENIENVEHIVIGENTPLLGAPNERQ